MVADRFATLQCALPGVLAVVADSRRRFARHTHDSFGIGVIDRGAQESASGRGRVQSQAGDIITVNPNEVHDGIPVDDAGRAWRMLYLPPALVAELQADITEGAGGPGELAFPTLRDVGAAMTFRRLFLAVTGDDGALPLQADVLMLHLIGLLRDHRPHPRPAAPHSVRLARQRIDDDPATAISLAALAQLAGISRFQLIRAFGAATGLPPHAYQMQRRLHLAQALIFKGTPLAQAAAAAGFADQSHMTRAFRRCHGLTPGVLASNFVQDHAPPSP